MILNGPLSLPTLTSDPPRHLIISGPCTDSPEYEVYLTIDTGVDLLLGINRRTVIVVSADGTTIFNESNDSIGVEIRSEENVLCNFLNTGDFVLHALPREAGLGLYNLARHMLGTSRIGQITSHASFDGFEDVTIQMPDQKVVINQSLELMWTGTHSDDFVKVVDCMKRFSAAEILR